MAELNQTRPLGPTEDEQFVVAIEHTIMVVRGLAPLFKNVDELVFALEVGLNNEGQRELLRRHLSPLRFKE